MVQMRVDGADREANLQRAETRLAEAREQGADLAVLPEALDLGWTHPAARSRAEEIPGGTSCRRLAAAARQHRLFVVAGLTERCGERVFNTAVLIDPAGTVILHHRKLNELEIGHDCYDQGDRLGVVDTRLGVLGLMICSDAFARGQIVARCLGLMGAQVILSPCAWAVPAEHDPVREPYGGLWRDNYRPVARDFRLWIAGVSNVGPVSEGPWRGRRCIGCSLLIGPEGNPVLEGPYGEDAEALLLATIIPEPRAARGAGWDHVWRAS
jgi:predicted amidohydrolase